MLENFFLALTGLLTGALSALWFQQIELQKRLEKMELRIETIEAKKYNDGNTDGHDGLGDDYMINFIKKKRQLERSSDVPDISILSNESGLNSAISKMFSLGRELKKEVGGDIETSNQIFDKLENMITRGLDNIDKLNT